MRVLFNKNTTLFINNGIFVFLMTQNLPTISKQFDGLIWRMEIDEISDTIYLEIRKAGDKLVSFAAIDLYSGKTKFENISLPERWLAGIEAAFNNVLLLHGYQSQSAPVHKGITAVADDGAVLWSNYSMAFDHLSSNGVITYATQLQPRKLFLIDVKTGANLRPFDDALDEECPNSIMFPTNIDPANLNLTLPLESYKGVVDYLLSDKYRIVSLHARLDSELKQHLYVWKGEEMVFEDLLNDDIQKMQPEAFILYKKSIIYIKNKTELKVISL